MSKPEFRVRPVVRHVVTRYTSEAHSGSLETLGEFNNEGYADIVTEALRERVAPREYVIVEQTQGDPMARVLFAYDEQEAQTRMAEMAKDGKSYRVFSRIKEPMPG